MIDPEVAMLHAVASALEECGYSAGEAEVDELVAALRSRGYTIERLDRRSGDDKQNI
jgi:hypothetical protein